MLTFEKVLDIFADYLEKDTDEEVVKASRGYVRIQWSVAHITEDYYDDCETARSPESLFRLLLNDVECYTEINLTKGKREVTDEDKEVVQKACQIYLKRREEAERV